MFLSTNGAEKFGYPPAKSIELDPQFIPFIKINLKWVINLM